MKYPKTATERFDKANIWIKYIIFQIRKYISGNTIEIGAGCGSFSREFPKKSLSKVILTDADEENINQLKKNFSHENNTIISKKNLSEFNEKFDTIIYFNVLEHIKEDDKEIKLSLSKLNKGGHLIILVPAHQKLYSNLDKAVGHFRRYDLSYFKKKFENCEVVCLKHLDTLGYFLYFLNKLVFKKEVYPTKIKIFIWDKIFTPLTFFVDFLLGYNYGKNILCIFKKN
tara:strand:+ start:871 stop:1554 length:684 start_codon:yes stop_codon:yes gene_type:complete